MAKKPMTSKQSAVGQLNDELEQGILRSVDNNALVALGIDRVGIDQLNTLFAAPLNAQVFSPTGFDEDYFSEVGRVEGSPVDLNKPTVIASVGNMAEQTPAQNRTDLAHEYGHAGIAALSDFKPHNIGPNLEEAIMRVQDMESGPPRSHGESQRYIYKNYDDPMGTIERAKKYHKQLSDKAQKKLYDEGKRMDIRDKVDEIASKGRYGDDVLVHMNRAEVQAMHENSPTGLTINPDTGQPEAFLPLLGALAGGWLAPSMGMGLTAAMGAGLGSAAGSLMQGDDFGTAVAGGLMSYGLGSMLNAAAGPDLGAVADTAAPELAAGATEAATAPALGGFGDTALETGFQGLPGQGAVHPAGMFGSGNVAGMAPVVPAANASPLYGAGRVGPTPFAEQTMLGNNPGELNAVGPLARNEAMLGHTLDVPRLQGEIPLTSSEQMFNKNIAQPNMAMSQAAGNPVYATPQPGSPNFVGPPQADVWDKAVAQNDTFSDMSFGDQWDHMKGRWQDKSIGPAGIMKDAITRNPIGTAAAGIGAMSGGLGALTGAGQQAAIPEYGKKSYAKRPYQKSGNNRSFIAQPAGYRPGIDPEHTYLDPIGTYDQSFAAGGIVMPGAGYRPGFDAQHNYGFGVPEQRATTTLAPAVPTIAPILPPKLNEGGGDRGQDNSPSNSPNDTGHDVSDHDSPGTPSTMGDHVSDNFDPALSLASSVLGAAKTLGGALMDHMGEADKGGFGQHGFAGFSSTAMGNAANQMDNSAMADNPSGHPSNYGGGGGGGHWGGDNDSGPGGASGASSGSGGNGANGGEDGGASDGNNWARGGQVAPSGEQNPITQNAKAAILGQHPEPAKAIQVFVGTYGEKAFVQLRGQVIAEATADQRAREGIGGMIQGPGTGTSDSIPGQITQDGMPVEDIKVADGEYIVPKAQVDEYKDNGMMAKLEGDRKAIVGKNNEPRMA
jgi:hypothetical protein